MCQVGEVGVWLAVVRCGVSTLKLVGGDGVAFVRFDVSVGLVRW